jgi:hypothetical protein
MYDTQIKQLKELKLEDGLLKQMYFFTNNLHRTEMSESF